MSTAVTRGIRVTVRAQYLPERSSPKGGQYAFAYTVRIANEGEETAQLRTRHWVITDGEGKVQEVRGEGVVGEKPILKPGPGLRVHELVHAGDAARQHAAARTRCSPTTASSSTRRSRRSRWRCRTR